MMSAATISYHIRGAAVQSLRHGMIRRQSRSLVGDVPLAQHGIRHNTLTTTAWGFQRKTPELHHTNCTNLLCSVRVSVGSGFPTRGGHTEFGNDTLVAREFNQEVVHESPPHFTTLARATRAVFTWSPCILEDGEEG